MEEKTRVEFERKVVDIFERRRISKGLSIDKFASILYPELPIANARMNLNRLRKPQVTGKPKRLLLGDFINFCAALELVPERVIAQAIVDILESK